MSYRKWEDFAEFAQSSIRSFNNSFGASVETYYKTLSAHSFMIISEKRNTLLDQESSQTEKEFYLKSMLSKIDFLYSNVFEELSIGLRFIPDNFIVTEDDDATISSARALHRTILTLKKEFLKESYKSLNSNKITSITSKRKKRIASRESFEIKIGKEVNLRAVHARLTDEKYPFIDASFDDFERVFTGAPVKNKVSWKYANALHYFIDHIYLIGIENATEGQWQRTSKCFTINGKDISPDKIKDDRGIAASTTLLLDQAITLFL